MAYGNWGAFVFKNGKRYKAGEDDYEDMEYHGLIGLGDISFMTYKSTPIIKFKGKEKDIGNTYDNFEKESSILNIKYHIKKICNYVFIKVIDLENNVWFIKGGYCYGAGYEEDCEKPHYKTIIKEFEELQV